MAKRFHPNTPAALYREIGVLASFSGLNHWMQQACARSQAALESDARRERAKNEEEGPKPCLLRPLAYLIECISLDIAQAIARRGEDRHAVLPVDLDVRARVVE